MQVSLDAALSLYHGAGVLIGQFGTALASSLGMCCLLVVAGKLTRSQTAGAAIGVMLYAALYAAERGTVSPIALVGGFFVSVALVVAILRVGLVAGAMSAFASGVVLTIPLTLDRSQWFSGVSYFAMMLIMVMAAAWAYSAARSRGPGGG
jgi:hypothetical protein